MSPYRTPLEPRTDTIEDSPRRDDVILAALLLVIGGVRVAIAFAGHEVFGGEASLALVMTAFAVVALVRRR